MVGLVDCLQTASSAFELQQGGDKLIKKVKEIQTLKWKSIQNKIDMLKLESLEALGKVNTELAYRIVLFYGGIFNIWPIGNFRSEPLTSSVNCPLFLPMNDQGQNTIIPTISTNAGMQTLTQALML